CTRRSGNGDAMCRPRRRAHRDPKSQPKNRKTADGRTSRCSRRRIGPSRIPRNQRRLRKAGPTRPIRLHLLPRSKPLRRMRPLWRRRTVGRLESVARGKPEPAHEWPADLHGDDEINAWFHARDRDKSVREVLSESRSVFQQLVSAIQKLPENSLDDPARFPWMEG